jgi:hypothetical protein
MRSTRALLILLKVRSHALDATQRRLFSAFNFRRLDSNPTRIHFKAASTTQLKNKAAQFNHRTLAQLIQRLNVLNAQYLLI